MIRIARNISRNLSRNLSRTVGTEPDLVLDSYSGASAAYSLYDLGNKRGTVVETEATYHNPAVRLRRDSDNTHKSFPGGAFTQMLNWANEDVAVCNDNLNNGGFETAGGGGADVFADWLENTSGSSTLTRDTSVFETGTASCRFNLDGSGSLVGISNNGFGIIEVGSTVEYSFRAKASSGSPSVAVGTALSTETVHALTTEWATYSGSFVVSARGNVSIKRNSTTANAEYWIDSYDVKITQANAYAATWYDQSGVSVTSTPATDDASSDGTSSWATADSTLAFDTDHYNWTYTTASQWAVLPGTPGISEGDIVRFSVDIKDGTLSGVDVGIGYSNDTATLNATDPVATQATTNTWETYSGIITATSSAGTRPSISLYALMGGAGNIQFKNFKVEVLDKAHNDATQTTADSQPKVIASGSLVSDANGNYALDFDGTDDHLDVATISESQPITGFVVANVVNSGGDARSDILDGTAADTNRILLDKNGASWRLFAGASLAGPTFTDNVDLLYFLADSTTSEIGLDGGAATTGDAGTNSGWASGLTIGTSISGEFLDGNISAIIIYPSDQSSNRVAIEQILSNTIQTALS